MTPTDASQLPLQHLDKACLAVTSDAHGLSNAPTWSLQVRGTLTESTLRQAVTYLLRAYPSAAARVRPLDAAEREWVWVLRGADKRDDAVEAVLTLHPPAVDEAAAERVAVAVRDRWGRDSLHRSFVARRLTGGSVGRYVGQ